MDPLVLSFFAFIAVVLAIVGAYSIYSDIFRKRTRVSQRIDDEFRKRQREHAQKTVLFKNLGVAPSQQALEEDRPVSWRERFVGMVEQSGVNVTPPRLLGISLVLGVGVAAVAFLLRLSPVACALLAGTLAALPILFVMLKRNMRLEKLRGQLPDAFDLMSRVIRAGQTVSQSMLAVADEFQAPIAGEFSYCYEQQNLGLPPEESMRDLARRTGLIEIKIFVLAMLVQQQTGGNLAELLEKLATVVRERLRMSGKIKALTAEGRFQALVLLALPPFMLLIILVMNRNYGQTLLDNPNLLVAMVISEGLGALWIRKIVNFDF